MSALTTKLNEIKSTISRIRSKYAMKMNFAYKEDLNLITTDNEWHKSEVFGEGVKFKAIRTHGTDYDGNIFLFRTPKGHIVDKHSHDDRQIIICVSGMLRIVLNNNEHTILKPWESVFIEKETLHITESLEDSTFISIWE